MISLKLITLWENTYGCAKNYRCAIPLYLLSMVSQAYYLIINRVMSAPGYGIEVADGLNDTDKGFSFSLSYVNNP